MLRGTRHDKPRRATPRARNLRQGVKEKGGLRSRRAVRISGVEMRTMKTNENWGGDPRIIASNVYYNNTKQLFHCAGP